MKKMRSYVNLTEVFLNPLNESLKKLIIRVKYVLQFINNAKKTWGLMKELRGEIRNAESSFPAGRRRPRDVP